MTKLIVPQIGDIVRGQVVTEAAHKLWVDLADKVATLEGVANDDLTDELTALGERVDAIETIQNTKPKIEVTSTFAPLENPSEEGYGVYQITCEAGFALHNSNTTGLSLGLYDEGVLLKHIAGLLYEAKSGGPIIVGSISGILTAKDFQFTTTPTIDVFGTQSGSALSVNPTRWIVHKYKLEY